MDYQNITLSIPKDILKRARLIAVQRQKSLSRMLAEYIEQIVESDTAYQKAFQRQVKRMDQGFELNLGPGFNFNREGLHER